MDKLNRLFENLDQVDEIVDNSNKVVQTALELSQDDAKAVVILCLALAKVCATAKVPAQMMYESVLEMEETYLLEEENPVDSKSNSN